jgi:acyl-coenzyme A synthetase/AMP-(fatty) acid ligase
MIRPPSTSQALLAFLKETRRLQSPAPRHSVPALPRNATGKILKTRLREWLAG